MLESEICLMTVTELAAYIRAKELSASEVMEAHLDRIERTNPLVNAIGDTPTREGMEAARAGPFDAELRVPDPAGEPGPALRHKATLRHRDRWGTDRDIHRLDETRYYVTVTGLPAASVPCGFTPEGLPLGTQILDRPGDDFGVLQLAHAFEGATEFWRRRPPLVRL